MPSPIRLLLAFALLLALAACAGEGGTPPVTLPPAASPTGLPATASPDPTATPLPPAALVILLAGEAADPAMKDALEAEISAQAAARGLRWQLRQTMSPEEIAAEADFLVALPPVADFNALVAGAPGTLFLAVDIPGSEPAPNLIRIASNPGAAEIEAFMGGYIGALITPDWRIGIITTEDDLAAVRFTAFENGMRFFCGLCRAQFAPFYAYPFQLSLPAGASAAEWQALADFMRDRFVGAVFVSPGTGGRDLIAALADHEITVIGSEPPPAEFASTWAASLRSDPLAAYLEHLPRLLEGEAGIDADLPTGLREVNPDLLTAGKRRLVEQTLADLLAGYILPGEIPLP